MNLLHICSDYFGSKVFENLLFSVSHCENSKHVMYVPRYRETPIGRHAQEKKSDDRFSIMPSRDFHLVDKLFRSHMASKIAKSIGNQMDLKEVDVVHAHSLFSMGAVAYKIRQRHGIKYICAVRNSDVNLFFRYGYHLRSSGINIIKHAAKVVFISPSLRSAVINRYVPFKMRETIGEKAEVIPNGIDRFWLNNLYKRNGYKLQSPLKLLFVGELKRNKNAVTVVRVLKELRVRGYETELTIVGSGPEEKSIMVLASDMECPVLFKGWVSDKQELMRIYRQSDVFIMPSITETFGLAYVEALSQGLPIIYTAGQGIEGFFENGCVGYACQPKNVGQIAQNIIGILNNYRDISSNATKSASKFSWDTIGARYNRIYEFVGGVENNEDIEGPPFISEAQAQS